MIVHPDSVPYNWLVHRIIEESIAPVLGRYARGILVDVGCGRKPYAPLTKGLVDKHIGVDFIEPRDKCHNIDILATAYATGLSSSSADTVLCTSVLEHLECPDKALREAHRILKPGGFIILSAPMFWHLHEEPRDFYRYTRFGLQHLLSQALFQVVEILPLSGFVVTFSQEFCYFLELFRRRYVGGLISGAQFILQSLAYYLRRWDKSQNFTWMYLVVAQKESAGDCRL